MGDKGISSDIFEKLTLPPTFVAVGHLSFDVNITENGVHGPHTPGGAAAYAGLTAHGHGFPTGILTSAHDDYPVQELLDGIDVRVSPSKHTTTFANYYASGDRSQILLASGDRIPDLFVPFRWTNPDIFFAGPLLHELPSGVLNWFTPRFSCLVPSGWLRRWGDDGFITHGDRLPNTSRSKWTVVVVSEAEVRDVPEEYLLGLGEIVCVTNGPSGARIWHRNMWSEVPAIPADPIDLTGAGDTWAAAFVIALSEQPDRLHLDVQAAGKYAAAAAAICIESIGIVGCPSRESINTRLASC